MKSTIYFILLIFLALLIRVYGIFDLKQNFSNDESVTYISATGNQVRYANLANPDSSYLNNFTQTTVWKNCYVSNPAFCFKKIAFDLAQYDIHPPLYFWLMHLFVLFFGLHLFTGLLLNLIISLCTLLMLFKLSKFIFNCSLKATMVCTLWFLSPAVVQMDLEARHYQLFALFALLLSYTTLQIIDNKKLSTKNIFFIVLFTTLGMLTHYYFAFIISGIFILFLIRFKFSKILAKITLSFMSGGVGFVLIFPQFIDFAKNYLSNNKSVHHINEYQSVADKIKTQLFATLDFGAYGHSVKYIYLLALLLLVGGVVYKIKKNKNDYSLFASRPITNILFLLLWNVLFTCILYMLKISPNQAVGEQYYSYIWTILSICLVYSFYLLKLPSLVITAYVSVLFIFCFLSVKSSEYVKREIPQTWYDEANKADLLVIDSYDRCLLPRTLYFINNNKPVFIGDVSKMNNYDSNKKIVLFYLINKKNEIHPPLSSLYKLVKKEKYADSQNQYYYMESYEK